MTALTVYPVPDNELVANGGPYAIRGGPAIGVYAIPSNADKPSTVGPRQPVYFVKDSELAVNGGNFVVTGQRMPVKFVQAGIGLVRDPQVMSGPAIPVYALDGSLDYYLKLRKLFGSSLIGYWPQWEPSGIISYDNSGKMSNGQYTGVVLGKPGIGDGYTSAQYDGVTSFDNIYSPKLVANFNPKELTLGIFCQVSGAGVWTDGVARRLLVLITDANNRVVLTKTIGNNAVQVQYAAGGVSNVVAITTSTTGWFHLAITVTKSGDAMKAYFNGVQSGATQTGLGGWAGALSSTQCCMGADTTAPANVCSGLLAHGFLLNRAATPFEIAIAGVYP